MNDPIVITNPTEINFVSMLARRYALKLEIAGLKRRGRPVSVIIREQIGSKTRDKTKLLEEYDNFLRQIAEEAGLPIPLLR